MRLTFYNLSGSPFAWKVWLSLEHKSIPYQMRVVSRDAGELATDHFRALNPHGKAPVIEHDGFALYESSAIVEYLEEGWGGESLWPRDARARAVARRVMAESQSYLYQPVRQVVEAVLMNGGAAPSEAIVRTALSQAQGAATILGDTLSAPFFNGESPGASDYSVYPLLAIMARLDGRLAAHGRSFQLPMSLAVWRERMSLLRVVAVTHPPHWS
jgi:glutathione S-transferase